MTDIEPKIIGRAEAKALGLKRYFTGKPCRHGHITERAVSGTCLGCVKAWAVRAAEGPRMRREIRHLIKAQKAAQRAAVKANSPRNQSRALGLKRYSTGKPCRHGHLCERYTHDTTCVMCARQKCLRSWHASNPETRRKNNVIQENRRRSAYRALRDLGVQFVPPVPVRKPIAELIVMKRREALALGFRRYFTGKPCKHGHLCERNINHGCYECHRIDKKRRGEKSYATAAARTAQKRRLRERQRLAYRALREITQQENANGCNA